MASRMSPGRRIVVAIAVVLAVVVWALAVVGWTALGRVSSSGGFLDVTIETIQSPTGIEATSSAITAQVEQAASAHGDALTAQGRTTINTAVTAVLSNDDLGTYLGDGIEAARTAFEAHPDQGLTIDLSALRPQVVAQLSAVNPQLAARVPATGDLVVNVPAVNMPSGIGTLNSLIVLARWLLWVLLGVTVLLLAIALLVSGDRARTLRRTGIAFMAVGILPLLMRLIIPPIVGGSIDGTPGAVAEVATSATIANWWIALVVTLVAGAVMIAAGVWLRQPARGPGGPTVLGR